MKYWLVKSEPKVYAWATFVKENYTSWDGIRNYAARIHLREMRTGDLCFFYHSNEGMNIVGIATVSKEHYSDPTTNDERWISVELCTHKQLSNPISLAEIKATESLQNMTLLKISRLSVQPVTAAEWKTILKMSGTKL